MEGEIFIKQLAEVPIRTRCASNDLLPSSNRVLLQQLAETFSKRSPKLFCFRDRLSL